MDSAILKSFAIDGQLLSCEPLCRGNINRTFVSTWRAGAETKRYLHQSINSYVFKDVPALMRNFSIVCARLQERATDSPNLIWPQLVPTRQGANYLLRKSGEFWRTLAFIENTETFDACPSTQHAYSAGYGFGLFLRALQYVNLNEISDPIPYFQNVPRRLEALEMAVKQDLAGRSAAARAEIEFTLASRRLAGVIEDAVAQGLVPIRLTHADPKINNVLFKCGSAELVSIVDLDTCMAGTSLYDFGDLVRSAGVPVREDEADLEMVRIDMSYYEALVCGYLSGTSGLLSPGEIELLPKAPGVIALSLGMRFLADFLNGDKYFHVSFPEHNLVRARTQLAIAREVLNKEAELVRIINNQNRENIANCR